MFIRVTSAENGFPMVLNVGFIRAVTHCYGVPGSIYPNAQTKIIFAYSQKYDREIMVEEDAEAVWWKIEALLKA